MVGQEGQLIRKKVSLPYRDMCICVQAHEMKTHPFSSTHTHFTRCPHLTEGSKSCQRAAFNSRPLIAAKGRLAMIGLILSETVCLFFQILQGCPDRLNQIRHSWRIKHVLSSSVLSHSHTHQQLNKVPFCWQLHYICL